MKGFRKFFEANNTNLGNLLYNFLFFSPLRNNKSFRNPENMKLSLRERLFFIIDPLKETEDNANHLIADTIQNILNYSKTKDRKDLLLFDDNLNKCIEVLRNREFLLRYNTWFSKISPFPKEKNERYVPYTIKGYVIYDNWSDKSISVFDTVKEDWQRCFLIDKLRFFDIFDIQSVSDRADLSKVWHTEDDYHKDLNRILDHEKTDINRIVSRVLSTYNIDDYQAFSREIKRLTRKIRGVDKEAMRQVVSSLESLQNNGLDNYRLLAPTIRYITNYSNSIS